ncbi:hypothetical protein AW893_15885 [Pseudomonas aeruginosa]|nr:hypothetical protein PA13_1011595 [Pseudomonas aeruginosa HB13]KXC43494.1 hypothetical protein AW891_16580 [Pseudomonas aeruginosa]KXC59341.1 hypothetical protein AW893_15885 [Pseudomonas aeruginosa]
MNQNRHAILRIDTYRKAFLATNSTRIPSVNGAIPRIDDDVLRARHSRRFTAQLANLNVGTCMASSQQCSRLGVQLILPRRL